MRALAGLTALVAVLAAGCGGEAPAPAGESPSGPASAAPVPDATGADPRTDGLEVALGEWALTTEAMAIRPGPVTFVIVNRGTKPHGFELEDESGGERVKVETRVLRPGESVRLELDLREGVYNLECLVDGHDDLGMEELLEVRPDAPLARERTGGGGKAVTIAGFAYEPRDLRVAAGEMVTWTNEDAAEHTVTHEGGAFGSETLGRAGVYRRRFERPGRFEYVCALHPEMRGTVIVTD